MVQRIRVATKPFLVSCKLIDTSLLSILLPKLNLLKISYFAILFLPVISCKTCHTSSFLLLFFFLLSFHQQPFGYINIYRHKHTHKKTYPNYSPFSITRLLFGHNQVTAMDVNPIWRISLSMRRQVLVARLKICLLFSESLERYNISCIIKKKRTKSCFPHQSYLYFLSFFPQKMNLVSTPFFQVPQPLPSSELLVC